MKIGLLIGLGAAASIAYLGKRLYDEGTAAAGLDWSYDSFKLHNVSTGEVKAELRLQLVNPGREFAAVLRRLALKVTHRGAVIAEIDQPGVALAPGTQQVVAVPLTLKSPALLTAIANIVVELAESVVTGGGVPPVVLDVRGTADVVSQVLGTNAVLPVNLSLDVVGAVRDYFASKNG